MITLAQFVNKKQLLDDQVKVTEIAMLESQLTKDNFRESAERVYEVMFGEKADPDVFTGHKFFHTKVVKPSFTRVDLMERGLHAFRMVMARHAERLRAPGIDQFDTEGVMMYEDFLSDNQAVQVKKEIEIFPVVENIQPYNNINNISEDVTSALHNLLHRSDLFKLCALAAHRSIDDVAAKEHFMKTTYIQRLENVPGNGDIQKVCHSDVFYPCVKYWYFPDAVKEDQGPFLFARNSVELDFDRLDFHYRESVKVVKDTWDRRRNKGHGEGSFRAIDDDLEKMNLELEPITCKPNTLVIANTSGFHCRGDAKQRHVRSALHGAIRVETPYDTYS